MLPLLALVVLLVAQLALAFVHWNNATQLAGDAARFAAVNRDPALALDNATVALRNGTGALTGPATVSACLPDGSDVGDPVNVQVHAEWEWLPLIGSMFGDPTLDIRGKATMRLERKATFGSSC